MYLSLVNGEATACEYLHHINCSRSVRNEVCKIPIHWQSSFWISVRTHMSCIRSSCSKAMLWRKQRYDIYLSNLDNMLEYALTPFFTKTSLVAWNFVVLPLIFVSSPTLFPKADSNFLSEGEAICSLAILSTPVQVLL